MIIEQIVIEWILAVLLLIFTILFFVYRKKYNSLKKNDSSEAPIPIQQTKNVVVHYFSEQSSDEIERKLSEVESLKNKINHLEKEKTFSKREQKDTKRFPHSGGNCDSCRHRRQIPGRRRDALRLRQEEP